MLTSETRQKTFKEIEKEGGTDAAIEAGILSDPDALYFQNLEEAEAARVARALNTTTAIHESAVFPEKMRVRKRILNNHGTA